MPDRDTSKMESMSASLANALKDTSIEVHIHFCDAPEPYTLSVPVSCSVQTLKRMVVGHFISPAAVAEHHPLGPDIPERDPTAKDFMLVVSDDLRMLVDDMSIAQEKIVNGTHLMLIVKNIKISCAMMDYYKTDKELTSLRHKATEMGYFMEHKLGTPPTEEEIHEATKHLPSRPKPPRQVQCSCKAMQPYNRLLLLRRVLLGVAHSSLRQLGDARLTQDTFFAILDKLERRHRSSMKPDSIQKLKEMGFSEAKAVIALKLKSSPEEAAHWLSENNPHKLLPDAPNCSDLTQDQDPVEVLMPRFWHFRRNYFVPHPEPYLHLVKLGHDATRVFDALMQSENNKEMALEVLEKEKQHNEDLLYSPPPAQHPIMASIFSSSAVLVSLHKPKVLYALLALCSNPNNANLWLSDPDTSGVVNLVLKVYYEERYNSNCSIPGPH